MKRIMKKFIKGIFIFPVMIIFKIILMLIAFVDFRDDDDIDYYITGEIERFHIHSTN